MPSLNGQWISFQLRRQPPTIVTWAVQSRITVRGENGPSRSKGLNEGLAHECHRCRNSLRSPAVGAWPIDIVRTVGPNLSWDRDKRRREEEE
jgi:hypothetical protein